jgi:glutaredoxin-like protein NrdH
VAPKVTVYTSPTCQPCRMTKLRLTRGGVEYDEVDLTADEHAETLAALKRSMQVEGMMPMPVVAIDGVVEWAEFRPDKIDSLIARVHGETSKS